MKHLLSVVFAILISTNANAGTWFNEAGGFVGYDTPNGNSPQCIEGAGDTKGTSNMGLWLNAWQSQNNRWRVDAQTTHHSCIFGADTNIYDSVGVLVKYTFWKRKR
jgi:hypothetical protein